MCGIAGIAGNQIIDSATFCIEANKIQKHRGPDNQSYSIFNNIGLAHQRLSILDVDPRSNQPYSLEGLHLVYNGEIYNYKLLRSEYLSDIDFVTEGDTEVLIHLWKKLGKSCLSLLEGMFSFALYDENQQVLFLARDRWGIKPLVFVCQEGTLAFASENKTLIKLLPFKWTVNKTSLVAAAKYLWIPGDRTMFNEINEVSPGSCLSFNIQTNSLEKTLWYDKKDLLNGNSTSNAEMFRCLEESIKSHLVSDVPVASFLSGGLDSSIIAKIASEKIKDFTVFTIGTNTKDKKIESMPDDEKYARRLSGELGWNQEIISIDGSSARFLDKLTYHLDEPIGDPAAINTFLMCSEAKIKGAKVLLSGMGADEIFTGYRRHRALKLIDVYRRFPSWLRYVLRIFVGGLPVRVGRSGLRLSRWLKKFITLDTNSSLCNSYHMSFSYYSDKELRELFSFDIEKEIETLNQEFYEVFSSGQTLIESMCYTDISYFMRSLNLYYSDKASMAASVELRVPFIDNNVINSAMGLSDRSKMYKGITKHVLREFAAQKLPSYITERSKASFGSPIRSWISGDMKEDVQGKLNSRDFLELGFFNQEKINDMIKENLNGSSDRAYQLYELLTIESWFRQFVWK